MFNQWTGIGRLSADPESRYTTSGKEVVNFTLCCDSGWGEKKHTEFVKCVAWEKLAGIISQYLKKGSLAFCQGRLQTRSWDDREGNKKYTTEVVLETMKMLGSKQTESRKPEVSRFGDELSEGVTDMDVPF
jgi:single-strand DNA-binding protein